MPGRGSRAEFLKQRGFEAFARAAGKLEASSHLVTSQGSSPSSDWVLRDSLSHLLSASDMLALALLLLSPLPTFSLSHLTSIENTRKQLRACPIGLALLFVIQDGDEGVPSRGEGHGSARPRERLLPAQVSAPQSQGGDVRRGMRASFRFP